MISERFLTYARVLFHVLQEEDLEEVVRPILEKYPRATMSEVRQNTREPLEGGCHVIVYLKKSDLEGGST
jgi:hypothetical protein